VRVRVGIDKLTGKARGFAFAEFGDDATAADAIRRYDGVELRGRRLRVNDAAEKPPPRAPRPDGAGTGFGGPRPGGGGFGGPRPGASFGGPRPMYSPDFPPPEMPPDFVSGLVGGGGGEAPRSGPPGGAGNNKKGGSRRNLRARKRSLRW